MRKVDLIARFSQLMAEAGYEPPGDRAGRAPIGPSHLTGAGSGLWQEAVRAWGTQGRFSQQVLQVSALTMRPSIHHRTSHTLADDIWSLAGYYDDMGAGQVMPGPAEVGSPLTENCAWRRRTHASGRAILFWNRLRIATLRGECGPDARVIRLLEMDDHAATRFLSLDSCVPFLIRPEAACRDMADTTLTQILGGCGDLAADIASGEWANGLLVALGHAPLTAASIGGFLGDIDAWYLSCLLTRRYAPLAQMVLCAPVWQALNGRHRLIERAARQPAYPAWSWPTEIVGTAVAEIRDVAGHGAFPQARELLDDHVCARLHDDPVCHALLDARSYDTRLVTRLLSFLLAECECGSRQACALHERRGLMCSDAAAAYALLCRRLAPGRPLMAFNSWISAVIFLKRRATFRALAQGVHAG